MIIKTKKSATGNLKTNTMMSDDLYKYYNFETDEQGEVIFQSSFIYRFKEKLLKNKEEIYLAWELVKFIKQYPLDFEMIYNFHLCVKNGQIKVTLGGDCAIIKNNLSDYENYLRHLEQEGMESYIEFILGENNEKNKDYLNTTTAQKINDIVLDAYYQRLHKTELDLLISLLTKVKNKEVQDVSEVTNIIRQIVKTI